MADDRGRALQDAVAKIKKQYGDGAVMRLGEATHLVVEAIPTSRTRIASARPILSISHIRPD